MGNENSNVKQLAPAVVQPAIAVGAEAATAGEEVKQLTYDEVKAYLRNPEKKEDLDKIVKELDLRIPYSRLQEITSDNRSLKEQKAQIESELAEFKKMNPDATRKEIADYKAEIEKYQALEKQLGPVFLAIQNNEEIKNLLRAELATQQKIDEIGKPQTVAESKELQELKAEMKAIQDEKKAEIEAKQKEETERQIAFLQKDYNNRMKEAFKTYGVPPSLQKILDRNVARAIIENNVSDPRDIPMYIEAEWQELDNSFKTETQKMLDAERQKFTTTVPAGKVRSASGNANQPAKPDRPLTRVEREEKMRQDRLARLNI